MKPIISGVRKGNIVEVGSGGRAGSSYGGLVRNGGGEGGVGVRLGE